MKRRSLLRTAAAGLAGLPGCAGVTGLDGPDEPTPSPTPTATPTASPTATSSPTPDGPASLADGWASFQGDARNSGRVPGTSPPTGSPAVAWTADLASVTGRTRSTRTASPASTATPAPPDSGSGSGSAILTAGRQSDMSLGDGRSAPVVVDGAVFLGTGDGRVLALDAADGRLRWQVRTDGPVQAAPAVAGDLVVAGSGDTTCYALDRASGRPVWTNRLDGQVATAPVIADRAVFVTTTLGSVHALDTGDGGGRWARAVADGFVSAPAVAGDAVLVAAGRTLFALDAATGRERWRVGLGASVAVAPTVGHGGAYVVTRDPAHLVRVEAGGTVSWRRDLGSAPASSVALADDAVVVGHGNRLAAFATDSRERWQVDLAGAAAPVVASDGPVPTVVAHGRRRLVGVDPATGDERWAVTLERGVAPAPAVADGTVYAKHGARVVAVE